MDWAALERALVARSSESTAYLDTRSGGVVYLTRGWSDDHAFTDGELDFGLAASRLVPIEPVPRETELGWMRGFTATLEDGWARDALARALRGPWPLREFEQALGFFPAERLAWLACRGERIRTVLRAWLEAHDLEADREPRDL